ncbi:heavy-metal-associated domain-containing protein [Prolixibacteraceae bacterium Z1-6]|uniref:Heavy-metal-associated domain-containing protein n=1 Tax=Draconibacterium aestuarii TaxID=2998507 RepID=A0A9X3F5R5_9BACT|nr:heavy-metal-associated domain-containing protein [Prolixibacteraceae bacterium Z1-6]
MERVVLKTDLSCPHCIKKVEPILKSEKGVIDYSIDLNHPEKRITISSEEININNLIANIERVGYKAERV